MTNESAQALKARIRVGMADENRQESGCPPHAATAMADRKIFLEWVFKQINAEVSR